MNRDEFANYRKGLLAERDLVRLDCMNPFIVMRYAKQHFTDSAAYQADDVLDLWAERMDMAQYRSCVIAAPGVRESLKGLFNLFARQNKDVWLPQDIYPFYWEAAQNAGVKTQSFATLPAPDFAALDAASDDSVVLITNPVSPLGRMMRADEADKLKAWLSKSPARRLIIDSVYAYTRGFDAQTHKLLETGQCILAHSLSKAWLERGVFGATVLPQGDLADGRAVLQAPPQDACNAAFLALKHQPDMPYEQQRDFTREWRRLTPLIRAFAPDFTPPETGYFAALPVPFEKPLNEHGTLVIPGSVFGSKNKNISVISCLHDIRPA